MRLVIAALLLLLISHPGLADSTTAEAAFRRGDPAAAYEDCKAEAEKGDAECQNLVGMLFQKGLGVPSDMNEALRLLRQPKMSMVADDQVEHGTNEPSGAMDQRETVAKVRAAIDRLPEHYRSALVLCEYEQMPYAEIATTLNASVPQIKTWIHRARRQLAVMLKELAGRS